eukprot:s36_g8.t1
MRFNAGVGRSSSTGSLLNSCPVPCGRQHLLFLAWIGVCLVVTLVFAITLGLEDARAIGLCCFAILGWSAQPGKTPIEYTSLAFLALLAITGAMDWAAAWKGMSSEGIWLIFCGMAMSLALTETSISQRIGQVLCQRNPTWPWLLLRLNVVGGLLALCVPSQVVRCQLVVPIARSVVNQMALEPLSCRSSAVLIALAVSTNHCGAAVLTGGLPNIIAVSALQRCSIDVTWGFWFVRMAPVYWTLSIVGNTLVLLCFTHREPGELSSRCDAEQALTNQALGPMTMSERAILAVFGLCMVMWIPFEKLKQVNFPVIIYTASLEALAPLLNAAPRAGKALSHAADAAVSVGPMGGPWRLAALFIAGMPLMFCNVCVPVALLVPELCPNHGLADAGIEPRLGSMIVAAMPSCVLLPFQNAPFLIALNIARDICLERHFVWCLVGNALFGFVVVLPAILGWPPTDRDDREDSAMLAGSDLVAPPSKEAILQELERCRMRMEDRQAQLPERLMAAPAPEQLPSPAELRLRTPKRSGSRQGKKPPRGSPLAVLDKEVQMETIYNSGFHHSWASTPSTRASPGLNQASWSDVSSPTGESPGVWSVRRRAATADARNFELEKAQALISDMLSGGKPSSSSRSASSSQDGRRRHGSEPPAAAWRTWASQMPVSYSAFWVWASQDKEFGCTFDFTQSPKIGRQPVDRDTRDFGHANGPRAVLSLALAASSFDDQAHTKQSRR